MKTLYALLFMCAICAAGPALGKSGHTGDGEWDHSLSRLNASAKTDEQIFNHRLAVHFDVEQSTIERLMQHPGFSAGDVSVVLKLSALTGRPVGDIVQLHDAEPGRGWGELAKSLGIKPGSREFHALKNDSKEFMDYWQGKGNYKHMKKKKTAKEHGQGKGKGKNKKNDSAQQ